MDRLGAFYDPQEHARLAAVRPHARLDAPPAAGGGLPVLFLSPALGSPVREYTVLAEDLASHGFAVVGLHHLHDSGPVAVPASPDGPAVGHHPRWEEMAPERAGLEEHFAFSRSRVEVLARDAAFVLDRLEAMKPGDGDALAAGLRLDRVAFVGHSIGAKAAALACRRDRRFAACVDLDGWPLPGEVEAGGLGTPLLYVEERRPERSDAWLKRAGSSRAESRRAMASLDARLALLFERSVQPGVLVRRPGIDHFSFGDRFLISPESALPPLSCTPEDPSAPTGHHGQRTAARESGCPLTAVASARSRERWSDPRARFEVVEYFSDSGAW